VLHVGSMGALPGRSSPLRSMWLVAFGVAVIFVGRRRRCPLSSLATVIVGCCCRQVVVGRRCLLGWLCSVTVGVACGGCGISQGGEKE